MAELEPGSVSDARWNKMVGDMVIVATPKQMFRAAVAFLGGMVADGWQVTNGGSAEEDDEFVLISNPRHK